MDITQSRCSQGTGSGIGCCRAKAEDREIGNGGKEEGRW